LASRTYRPQNRFGAAHSTHP